MVTTKYATITCQLLTSQQATSDATTNDATRQLLIDTRQSLMYDLCHQGKANDASMMQLQCNDATTTTNCHLAANSWSKPTRNPEQMTNDITTCKSNGFYQVIKQPTCKQYNDSPQLLANGQYVLTIQMPTINQTQICNKGNC